MRISVVIPAHNEECLIGRLLQSLSVQKRQPDEVIVVCDDCSDHTATEVSVQALKSNSKTQYCVENVNYRNSGKSRNHGITMASGDVIVVMDADTEASDGWLEAAEMAVLDGYEMGAAALASDRLYDPSRNGLQRFILDIIIQRKNKASRKRGAFHSSGTFFTRKCLEEFGRYQEYTRFDEHFDLCHRVRVFGGKHAYIEGERLTYCDRRFAESGYVRRTLQLLKRSLKSNIQQIAPLCPVSWD